MTIYMLIGGLKVRLWHFQTFEMAVRYMWRLANKVYAEFELDGIRCRTNECGFMFLP
jgi:hypothetical protein